MSDTDGFIDEVNDELRRDRLAATFKRYGWIAVLAVLVIVGGAAFSEYRKAQVRAQAEALGDAMLSALEREDGAARAAALQQVEAENARARAVVSLLAASEQIEAEDRAAAITELDAVAVSADIPQIYRQIAVFKALTLQSETLPAAERRQGFEALASAGGALRLLAHEQLALIDIEEGNTAAAITGYQSILTDAQVTPDLQQRALQVIVALGGEPELGGAPLSDNADAPQIDGNG
ncbi:hypothetical protein [uncultured Sulfitobacter sp.]|uniref:hypothetical protein n=1 Tax=uncultured Sulfitobacter sp. TaxID=191468 RepID=UPI0026239AE5|nr:hypothetical protein [uncultured Sulfitobacter sp.]